MTITTNHNDIIAVAHFVRNLGRDTLWAVMCGETSASELLVTMAHAEWRFRFDPR